MKDAGVLTALVNELHTSPQAADELLALWEGLPLENQIQALTNLRFPEHLQYGLLRQAIKTPNAYVRYLAARYLKYTKFSEYEGHEAIIKAIQDDVSPLVRNSLYLETEYENFWTLPHEMRLRIVRQMRDKLDFLLHIVREIERSIALLQAGEITTNEVLDVLSDAIESDFRRMFADRWGVFKGWDHNEPWPESEDDKNRRNNGIEIIHRLWRVVPIAPEEISKFLFERLPVSFETHDLIPSDVVDALPPEKLGYYFDFGLFNREAVWLLEKRKAVFHSTEERFERVREAAIKYHYELFASDDEKLEALLANAYQACSGQTDNGQERRKRLVSLGKIGKSAKDLSPLHYAAMLDLYNNAPSQSSSNSARNLWHTFHDEVSERGHLIDGLKEALLKVLEKQKDYAADWHIRQVRIFRWAADASRGWITITDEQKRSSTKAASLIRNGAIKEGNAWETYKAFSTLNEKDFPFPLPRLEEIGECATDSLAIAELRRELKSALRDVITACPENRTNRAIDAICSYCSKKEDELKEAYDGFVGLKRSQDLWAVLWAKVVFAIFIMLSIIIAWLVGGSIIHYLF